MNIAHPSMRRRTSSYKLAVKVERGAEHPTADVLRDSCPEPVEQTGVNPGEAFIRFRAGTAEAASDIARRTTSGPFVLSLGYGAHYELVEVYDG